MANTNNKKNEWYIVSTAISLENKTKEEILKRVKAMNMENKITDIIIPTQKKIVIKNGQKKIKEERLFPGYILIQMKMDTETFTLIRNVEGVKGFISNGKKPKPLTDKEVENIMKSQENKKPTYQKTFQPGDAIKISNGAFTDFVGTVKDVKMDKGKITVMITIFGRETPVELDFNDVKKL